MKLYRTIIFAQDGELIDKCDKLYKNGRGVQDIIEYLAQWDADEWDEDDITADEPSTSPNGIRYADDKGEYTLMIDNTLEGGYMLYREAYETEMCDWLTNAINEAVKEVKDKWNYDKHVLEHELGVCEYNRCPLTGEQIDIIKSAMENNGLVDDDDEELIWRVIDELLD